MSIVLVGLNHRTAPVELREQLSLNGCGLIMALEELRDRYRSMSIDEVVILSTCNRLEVYAATGDAPAAARTIKQFLADLQGLDAQYVGDHLYTMVNKDAVNHLMRVASGLDSLVLGEPQILGQVGDALAAAQTVGTAGGLLSHLFNQASHAGKRARTETQISRHTTSVSHVAALLAKDVVGPLDDAIVLLIGAGEMAELAAQALIKHGAGRILCINRTFSRAESLAQVIGGEPVRWYDLPNALVAADVVISATGAPHVVIQKANVATAIERRGGRPLVFIDVALPRDIEPAVCELPGVTCYDIDNLQHTLDENLAQRKAAIPDVEAIIDAELDTVCEWISSRQVVPVITDLRRKAADVARLEVEQALRRLDHLTPEEQAVIEKMAHRIVNKILHEPTIQLRQQAAAGNGYVYARAVRDLFDLATAAAGD
ncbi:MAG: glutamyl-tRNA reductase [Chloroflexi bacterium]|nr:glutamyl-tRNA reductase [Chloroflexota bacterium]